MLMYTIHQLSSELCAPFCIHTFESFEFHHRRRRLLSESSELRWAHWMECVTYFFSPRIGIKISQLSTSTATHLDWHSKLWREVSTLLHKVIQFWCDYSQSASSLCSWNLICVKWIFHWLVAIADERNCRYEKRRRSEGLKNGFNTLSNYNIHYTFCLLN